MGGTASGGKVRIAAGEGIAITEVPPPFSCAVNKIGDTKVARDAISQDRFMSYYPMASHTVHH